MQMHAFGLEICAYVVGPLNFAPLSKSAVHTGMDFVLQPQYLLGAVDWHIVLCSIPMMHCVNFLLPWSQLALRRLRLVL